MNLTSVRERLERRRRRRRNTQRFRQIASVAVRYGLADRLRKMHGKRMQQWLRGAAGESIVDLGTSVRIRLALSELGTTFIKFGQMLSTRPDLVGQDVAAELTHLQSRTPPDPPGAADSAAVRLNVNAKVNPFSSLIVIAPLRNRRRGFRQRELARAVA